jgi:biotin carboxyl carrier protein
MEGKEFRAIVHGEKEFTVKSAEVSALDIIHLDNNQFHILEGKESVHVEVVEVNYARKEYTLLLEGQKIQLRLADHFDSLVKQMGLSESGSQKVTNIMAPMPGLVLDILVEVGSMVSAGDPVLILEAMKMENIIKAGGDGRISNITVKKGNAVDKGQLLVELD